jgi:gamma-glutamyltranspeptidase/glutathione hydrolase
MVSSQHGEATRIGVEILERGGNAIDAAVAVGFALAVTLPRAGNLGGGGFMVVHLADRKETVTLDYREMAPAAAHRDLFLDGEGHVDMEKAQFSHLSSGVPGTVAGFALALEKWGSMSLKEVLAPAIRLAEEGVLVSQDMAANLHRKGPVFEGSPASMAVFFKPDGSAFQAGDRLVQKDLAWSLRQIAEHGPKAFYQGAIGQKIVADMEANGGLITLDDLAAYRPVERQPVRGTYRGYEIVSMAPPSSGGIHLIQMLNLLEAYPLGELGAGTADTIHLMAEVMKLAYADRSEHLGDPDHYSVPVAGLISKAYGDNLRKGIAWHKARPSAEIKYGDPAPYESPDTTHYSVMDAAGNAVAQTYTLNFSYGSGRVAAGTGILLNNEMDDFSSKPGVPNAYGLIGGEANAIGAGKRPLSSMTPTLVIKDGKVFLVTGSPGGSRIITTVLQIVLNIIDHEMNIASATAAPRVHHQWLPDEIRVEVGLGRDTIRLLEARGHKVAVLDAMGSTQSILSEEGRLFGAADPRRPDALALGF